LKLSEKESEEMSALIGKTNDETIQAKVAELERDPKGCGLLLSDFSSGKEDLQRYLPAKR